MEDLIDAISEVTLDSGDAIKAAREAHDALTDEQKELVGNYHTLLDAEARYEELTRPSVPGISVAPSKPSRERFRSRMWAKTTIAMMRSSICTRMRS